MMASRNGWWEEEPRETILLTYLDDEDDNIITVSIFHCLIQDSNFPQGLYWVYDLKSLTLTYGVFARAGIALLCLFHQGQSTQLFYLQMKREEKDSCLSSRY